MKGYRFLNKNKKMKLPVTEKMSQGIFSLPLYPEITSRDLKKITNSLKSILKSI